MAKEYQAVCSATQFKPHVQQLQSQPKNNNNSQKDKNSHRDSSGTPIRLPSNDAPLSNNNLSTSGRQQVSSRKQRLVSAKNRNFNVFQD